MAWTTIGGMGDAHRQRLLAAGVDSATLAELRLHEVSSPSLGTWWKPRGNALYLATGVEPPRDELVARMVGLELSDALVVLASPTTNLISLLIGDEATVFVGDRCELTAGEIFCGTGSSIVLCGDLTATRCASVDARNGGSVVAARGQLWASGVYIATDDMHRLADAETGARLNPFGAHIRIGEHVWLCRDAAVTGHVEIGDGAVVGQRSLVRGQKVPARSLVVGVPARVVRDGVTWSVDDTP